MIDWDDDDPPDAPEILEGVPMWDRIPCERADCGHSSASHSGGVGRCIAADCDCIAYQAPTGERADQIAASLRFEPRDKSTLRVDRDCPDCKGSGFVLIPTVVGYGRYQTCRRCRARSEASAA